jgi:hypothetical protein
VVLRPATLEQTAPGLRQASLTLSCSYHVALTSLMLEVPAVLLSNNPYYAQKAAGLREDFELPAPFTTTASADPVLGAREIATTVLDGEHRAAQRRRLATQASHVIRRRCSAETELLAHMGSAAMTALSNRIEVLAERLRERSAEPVELLAQVAKLQSEQEELRRLGEVGSPLEAELRAQEAEGRSAEAHEQLATILHSRSWRILAPLRWLGALLRRR